MGSIPTARTIDVWQAPIGCRTVAEVCLSGPRTSRRAEQVDLRAHGVSSLVNYLAYAGLKSDLYPFNWVTLHHDFPSDAKHRSGIPCFYTDRYISIKYRLTPAPKTSAAIIGGACLMLRDRV